VERGWPADRTDAAHRRGRRHRSQLQRGRHHEHERDSCGGLIAAAGAAGAVVAITAGAHPNTILVPGRQALTLDVPTLDRPIDDLGAGDVFAAAFSSRSAKNDPRLRQPASPTPQPPCA